MIDFMNLFLPGTSTNAPGMTPPMGPMTAGNAPMTVDPAATANRISAQEAVNSGGLTPEQMMALQKMMPQGGQTPTSVQTPMRSSISPMQMISTPQLQYRGGPSLYELIFGGRR